MVGAKIAIFLSFNGADPIPSEMHPSSTAALEVESALAAMLLWGAGCIDGIDMTNAVKRQEAYSALNGVGSPEAAMNKIRSAFQLGEKDVVLVCIDELVRLAQEDKRGPILAAAMRFMDKCKGSTVFVFSALTTTDVKDWRGNTGREIHPGPSLPLLEQKDVEEAVQTEAGAAKVLLRRHAVRRLLMQCVGHPRAVFDWFLPTLRKLHEEYDDVEDIPVSAIAAACQTASTKLRLPDIPDALISKLVSPVGLLSHEEFLKHQRSGLLYAHEGQGFLLPILLREWARARQDHPLLKDIRMALGADDSVGPGAQKFAETVLVHWDAARRRALGNTFCGLARLFKGARIGTDIARRLAGDVSVCPQGRQLPDELVQYVDSFEAAKLDLLDLLGDGGIVVSRLTTEKGVEYLAPLWDRRGNMFVALAQVKVQPKGDTFKTLAQWALEAVTPIFDELNFPHERLIPLLLTTHETTHRVVPAHSVCFGHGDLAKYTRPLGPDSLRMLTNSI